MAKQGWKAKHPSLRPVDLGENSSDGKGMSKLDRVHKEELYRGILGVNLADSGNDIDLWIVGC